MCRQNHPSPGSMGRAARCFLALSLAVALLASVAGLAAADEVTAKMVRQMGVMEKILDKLLLDSQNFLVRGGNNARGLYIPEFGALFTFEASLTDGMYYFNKYMKGIGEGFEVSTDKDGNQVIKLKKNKNRDREEDSADSEEPKEPKEPDESDEERSERVYREGKEELMQMLLDYGETLTAMPDDQWIGVAAFMDSNFLKDSGLTHLFIRARMSDLRAFGNSRLSAEEVKAKIVVDEY